MDLINDNRVIIKRVALIGNKNDSRSQKIYIDQIEDPKRKKRDRLWILEKLARQ